VHEISQVGQSLIFETFVVIEILVQMAVLYLIIIGGVSFLSRRLEKGLAA
jgi:ABC-type amino acid transport system permease subunit